MTKVGNSYAIPISQYWMRTNNIDLDGYKVDILIEDNRIVLKPRKIRPKPEATPTAL